MNKKHAVPFRSAIVVSTAVLLCSFIMMFQPSTSIGLKCFAQAHLPAVVSTDHDPLKDYTVVRCLFKEGRLVVKHDGKLVVLRQGDRLPGAGPVVESISSDKIVLKQGKVVRKVEGKTVAGPQSIIVITPQPGGKWKTEVFSTESDAPQGVLAGAPLVVMPPSQRKPEQANPSKSPASDSRPKPSEGSQKAP